MTKWFHFHQNNSGGFDTFNVQRGITKNVVIEAHDAAHANVRAEQIGLYFNGCASGMDCSCCGDRWDEVYDNDANDVPEVYGHDLRKEGGFFSNYNWETDEKGVCVHPLDGPFVWYQMGKKSLSDSD